MKKILWLIFLSLLSVPVLAKETYYSKYTPYSEFTDKYVLETDTVSVKEENRYKWYKEEITKGDYKLYNKEDNFTDDCYLKELSKWSNEKIDNPGYVYQTRNKYKFLYSRGARYIHLYNLQGSYGSFRLTEFNVKIKNKNIDYSYECNGCWGNFKDAINNGIYDENESYIKNNGSIIFDLKKEYPVYLIDTLFYIFDLGDSDKKFTIGYSNDKINIYLHKDYDLKFKDNHWTNAKKINALVDEESYIPDNWQYTLTSSNDSNSDFIMKKENYKEYAYQEKWCKVNNVNRIYTDYTNKSVEGYKKDLKTKKVYYSYKTRDKMELDVKDITKKIDLKDFVLSSTKDVKIEDNINWNENGKYKIKFILNDLEVNKYVNLNLEENSIRKLEEENKLLNDKIKELNNLIDLKDKELIGNKKDYDTKLDELNDLIEEKEKLIGDNKISNDKKIKELNKLIEEKEMLLKDNNSKNDKKLIELNELINKYLKDIENMKKDNTNKQNEILHNNNICKNNNDVLNNKLNNLDKINKEIIKEHNNNLKINDIYKQKINELENNLLNLNNGASSKLKEKDKIIKEYESKLDNQKKEDNIIHNRYLLKINNIKSIGLLLGLIFILLIMFLMFRHKK